MRNVLSLFDGISCARLALDRAGISYETYYASEIDRYAIAVAKYNYPDTVFVGDVRNLDGEDFKDIDLIIGGSPCQNFSFSGKRQGMVTREKIEVVTLEQYLELKEQGFEFEGQSYLFWEFTRLLKEIKPKYFLLENVRMAKKWERVITNALGVEPIKINSSLVSAQNRVRLYWTNIPVKGMPEDRGILLKDILEVEVDEKYYIDKPFKLLTKTRKSLCKQLAFLDIRGHDYIKRIYSVDAKSPALTTAQGGYRQPKILVDRSKSYCIDACYYKGGNLKQYFEKSRRQLVFPVDSNGNIRVRKLTPVECERLQTIPDNYTKFGLFEDGKIRQLSDTQRYRLIGNAFTVDVIAWMLSFISSHERER